MMAAQLAAAFLIWLFFLLHYRREAKKMNERIQEMKKGRIKILLISLDAKFFSFLSGFPFRLLTDGFDQSPGTWSVSGFVNWSTSVKVARFTG